MAAFRQAARNRGWMEREELMREVLKLLDFERRGPRKRETLKGHMRAAIRRMILEADGDTVRIQTPTTADYPRDFLQRALSSVMRPGTTYEREDIIHAVAGHLGFKRVREEVRDPIKSAITRR